MGASRHAVPEGSCGLTISAPFFATEERGFCAFRLIPDRVGNDLHLKQRTYHTFIGAHPLCIVIGRRVRPLRPPLRIAISTQPSVALHGKFWSEIRGNTASSLSISPVL
jgi:hypothetical protein